MHGEKETFFQKNGKMFLYYEWYINRFFGGKKCELEIVRVRQKC